AVVDEGPGLSGSSLASVARWLFEQGVESRRIRFFPSHAGRPGPCASLETRALWDCVTCHPASEHDMVVHSRGLRRWVEEKIGPLQGTLREVSCDHGAVGRVPRDTRFERRKLIARSAKASW